MFKNGFGVLYKSLCVEVLNVVSDKFSEDVVWNSARVNPQINFKTNTLISSYYVRYGKLLKIKMRLSYIIITELRSNY